LRAAQGTSGLTDLVECLRGAAAPVAGTEPRHTTGILLHFGQHRSVRTVHTGSGRTSAIMGLLQLRFWHVDVRSIMLRFTTRMH